MNKEFVSLSPISENMAASKMEMDDQALVSVEADQSLQSMSSTALTTEQQQLKAILKLEGVQTVLCMRARSSSQAWMEAQRESEKTMQKVQGKRKEKETLSNLRKVRRKGVERDVNSSSAAVREAATKRLTEIDTEMRSLDSDLKLLNAVVENPLTDISDQELKSCTDAEIIPLLEQAGKKQQELLSSRTQVADSFRTLHSLFINHMKMPSLLHSECLSKIKELESLMADMKVDAQKVYARFGDTGELLEKMTAATRREFELMVTPALLKKTEEEIKMKMEEVSRLQVYEIEAIIDPILVQGSKN